MLLRLLETFGLHEGFLNYQCINIGNKEVKDVTYDESDMRSKKADEQIELTEAREDLFLSTETASCLRLFFRGNSEMPKFNIGLFESKSK